MHDHSGQRFRVQLMILAALLIFGNIWNLQGQVASPAVPNARGNFAIDASGVTWRATTNGETLNEPDAALIATTAVPVITFINPAAAAPGASISLVTVFGSDLNGATAVTFSGSGVTAAITDNSHSLFMTISLNVSAGAALGRRTFTVTTPAGTSTPFDAFTVADQSTLPVSWKLRSYLSDPRRAAFGIQNPAANLIGNRIYLSHGLDGSANTNSPYAPYMSSYDLTTNSWVHGGPSLPDANVGRFIPAAATALGKHYVIGGTTENGATAAVEAFDPAASTWSSRASMSGPRTGAAAASLNNKIYVMGGNNGNGAPLSTNEVYDPALNTWTTLAPMPTASNNCVAVGYNGKVYVITGESSSAMISNVQIYDPSSNTWSAGTPIPTPRSLPMAGVLSGQIVVFGGHAGGVTISTNLNATEFYDPATNIWTLGPAMPFNFWSGARGETSNGTQAFSIGWSFAGYDTVQLLDSSTGATPNTTSIMPSSGGQRSTISATIGGANLSGATSVVLTGTGVAATVVGSTSTSVDLNIAISNSAETGSRMFSVNTSSGTSPLFNGFTVLKRTTGELTSQ